MTMLTARFWSKVDVTPDHWRWTAYADRLGYGYFRIGGKAGRAVPAHRLAYADAHGPIPDGLLVDHVCYTPSCVNPAHLRLATPAQNQRNRSGAESTSATGVRGVHLRPNGRYRTHVTVGGRVLTAGSFSSLVDAEQAVTALRRELFGAEWAGQSRSAKAAS